MQNKSMVILKSNYESHRSNLERVIYKYFFHYFYVFAHVTNGHIKDHRKQPREEENVCISVTHLYGKYHCKLNFKLPQQFSKSQ